MSRKVPRPFCRGCGNLCPRPENVYCSGECFQLHKLTVWINRWLSGEIVVTASRPCKRAIIHLRGEKCESCGWQERHPITGKVPIEIEHKDGNYLNNSPENVQLLCPNCHSLTLTFRGLNRGNGRAYRRKAALATA